MSDILERSWDWAPVADTAAAMDALRSTVLGHNPGRVTRADGSQAHKTDIGQLQRDLAEALEDPDGNNLVGYSVVFGQEAPIRDEHGAFLETIAPGAADRTLRNNGNRIVVQFDHGTHPLIGSIPIAATRAVWADEHGVFGWDRMHVSPLFGAVREAIQTGAIAGQSFRFSVPDGQETWDYGDPVRRTIHEVRIYERGPVVFPAYAGTDVALRMMATMVDRLGPDAVRAAAEAAGVAASDIVADEQETVNAPGSASGATREEITDSAGPASGATRQTRRQRGLILRGMTHVQAGHPAGAAGSARDAA